MPTYRPEDLYSAGEQVQDFTKGLATDIANQVCALYRDSPKGLVTGTPLDATGQFLRGYWDSFCGRLPEPKLPEPPKKPFSGGQCPCSRYKVTVEAMPPNNSVLFTGVGDLRGPIGAATVVKGVNSSGSEVWRVQVTSSEFCDGGVPSGTLVSTLIESGSEIRLTNQFVEFVSGTNNSSDNCGDLPADYPNKTLPPPSSPGVYRYPSPGDNPPEIPYTINVDPNIIVPIVKVDVNIDADVAVNFDAGGISINFPDSGGISPEEVQRLLDAADGVGGLKDEVGKLKDGVDDVAGGGQQVKTDKGEKEGNDEGDEPNIAGLEIVITGIPLGAGRKFGTPQLFDFGRAHFKRGDLYTEEVSLVAVRQWVKAPSEATGYAVQLRNGVKANVTVVTQVKQNGG